jgi:D-alanyl-D-alanine carboxypeptidase (penicillin-binding protein 5/6)
MPEMDGRLRFILAGFFLVFTLLFHGAAQAREMCVNSHSAILIDMTTGRVLFEQNADAPIAPASITKVLTLYVLFDAIREGRVHLNDHVEVSRRAASTGGSRMGLRAGQRVPMEELIKGMAIVSGNDACVAVAEHVSGDVETFVRRMNAKARELGMKNSRFMTPNGLPAKGQITTARDVARLSIAYLRRFPDSLVIHSMKAYTYNASTHRNANRLLGKCEGVDGLKTGFVCASGYNITATAKRGDVRLLAVVMGAPGPGVRATETARLIEAGFEEVAPWAVGVRYVDEPSRKSGAAAKVRTSKATAGKHGDARVKTASAGGASKSLGKPAKSGSTKPAASPVTSKSRTSHAKKTATATEKKTAAKARSGSEPRPKVAAKSSTGKAAESAGSKVAGKASARPGKDADMRKTQAAQSSKTISGAEQAHTSSTPSRKNGSPQKPRSQAEASRKKNQG